MVCSTTVGTSKRSWPAIRSTMMLNGTNVMSDTSFVISMLNTNGRKINTKSVARVEDTFFNKLLPK